MPPGCSVRLPALATGALLGLALGLWGWLGAPALEVVQPAQPVLVRAGGVPVFVRFPGGRALASTLRARLNGVDVTDQLAIAGNGAYGTLYGLLDGENTLELAVFASGPWRPGALVEEVRVFEVHYRPRLDWNRG